MESLALAAAVVMLVIISCGIVSLAVIFRPPTSLTMKVALSPFIAGSIALGLWMVTLEVGIGARLIGLCALAAGMVGGWRMWVARRKG